jgi:Ser/Thr protein kinase RdoA (MazF antagonist)
MSPRDARPAHDRRPGGTIRAMPDTPPTSIEPLDPAERAAAARILDDAWGAPVVLERTEVVWERDHVVRLHTDDGRTAILKRQRTDDTASLDDHQRAFAAEWASLELLASTPDPVAPRLLGGDAERALLVVEELPPGPSLAQSLLGDDPAVARADLVRYAEAVASMNVHGIRHADEHRDILRRHGLPADQRSRWVDAIERERPRFAATLADLGVDGPADARAVTADLDELVPTLTTGSYVGFVHGDACPDNVRFVDGRCRAFDFERSSPGSVALDAAYLVAPFPSCWCFARLPPEAADAAVAAHRAVLRAGGVDVDATWDHAVAVAIGGWIVARTPLLVEALADDRLWGTTTLRPRLLAWTSAFPRQAAAAGALPALAARVERLHDVLSARWPDAAVPAYPALAVDGAPPAQTPADWSPEP